MTDILIFKVSDPVFSSGLPYVTPNPPFRFPLHERIYEDLVLKSEYDQVKIQLEKCKKQRNDLINEFYPAWSPDEIERLNKELENIL